MKPLLNQLLAQLGRRFYRHRHFREWGDTPQLDVAVSNLCIDLAGAPIQLRMYHGKADRPMVIFYHGGGWVLGDLDTHDRFCRALSNESSCSLVSVNYRLAPEFPFPAAHDDCLGATRWIVANIENRHQTMANLWCRVTALVAISPSRRPSTARQTAVSRAV